MARDIGIYPGVRASRTPQAQAQAQRRTRPRTYTRRAQRNRAAPHPVHTVNALRTQRHEQAGHDPAAASRPRAVPRRPRAPPPSAMRPPWAPPASARGSRPRPRPPSARARWRRRAQPRHQDQGGGAEHDRGQRDGHAQGRRRQAPGAQARLYHRRALGGDARGPDAGGAAARSSTCSRSRRRAAAAIRTRAGPRRPGNGGAPRGDRARAQPVPRLPRHVPRRGQGRPVPAGPAAGGRQVRRGEAGARPVRSGHAHRVLGHARRAGLQRRGHVAQQRRPPPAPRRRPPGGGRRHDGRDVRDPGADREEPRAAGRGGRDVCDGLPRLLHHHVRVRGRE